MKHKPRYIRRADWDGVDSPPLSDRVLASMRPVDEAMPDVVAAFFRARGAKKAGTKVPVSMRLSRDVLAYFKTRGKGWQARIDEVLRAHVKGR